MDVLLSFLFVFPPAIRYSFVTQVAVFGVFIFVHVCSYVCPNQSKLVHTGPTRFKYIYSKKHEHGHDGEIILD